MNNIVKQLKTHKYGELKIGFEKDKYKEFTTYEEASNWGKQFYGVWAKQYKENMEEFKKIQKEEDIVGDMIECYCGYAYDWINEYLRFSREDNKQLNQKYSVVLAILLTYAPRIPEDIVLYRLVCNEFVEELINKNKKGGPTREKGFLSTSLLPDIVDQEERYAKHEYMLKVYVKKGTVGIYTSVLDDRKEEEILCCPNGYIWMLKYPYRKYKKRIIECELQYF